MLFVDCAHVPAHGGASPTLRQDQDKMLEERVVSPEGCDLTYIYYTTNSSSSDITSPVTPTFSARSHLRYSSSVSSLELTPLPQDPLSPTLQLAANKTGIRQLPDVEEEPLEREINNDEFSDSFDLYSCLCDQACEHRSSSEAMLVADEFDVDYDLGFLSDDATSTSPYKKQKRLTGESTIMALTSRLGSRFPGITRWRSTRQSNLMASPTTELSLESAFSGLTSSRSSSRSARARQEVQMSPTPVMQFYESSDNLSLHSPVDISRGRDDIEHDRSMATTPLLPPMLTDPLGKPPQKSPLASPSIEPVTVTELPSPSVMTGQLSRPSLSSRRPSLTSLRQLSAELPIPLPPSMLQDQDEWSDRLGHANFTITPAPYEVSTINAETVTKFREDWNAARVNYTKHLVRTGENYGQTSKIYALTEAKWAEIERKWKSTYEDIIRQTQPVAPAMMATRSRSRGRGRGRTESYVTTKKGHFSHDDVYAAVHWQSMGDCLPSAVPQMLEALDAEGKFPGRGDEDIVGPMQRDAVMMRARSEEAKGPRFWKNLTEKLRR